MALKEHQPGCPFPGVIGRSVDESAPAWPLPARAPALSPNGMVGALDDTGYGLLGAHGSPIGTPRIDRLAGAALGYGNMP